MSVQNRAAGSRSKTGTKTEPNVTTIKQTVKTETIKAVEKEKKQVVIIFQVVFCFFRLTIIAFCFISADC